MTDDELIEAAKRDGWEAGWQWKPVELRFDGFGRAVIYDTTTHLCEYGDSRSDHAWLEPDEVLATLQELKGMPA